MERAGEESAAPLGSGSFERQDALARPDVERDRVTDITAISRCIAFGGIVGWTHRSRLRTLASSSMKVVWNG